MEQLKLKYDQVGKAIDSLRILIDKQDNLKSLDPLLELVTQEALIKRFEYSIDTLWKYEKLYLKERHGVEVKTPKSVFRELFRIGILKEEETNLALEMVNDRNLTAHTYSEELAHDIVETIPQYCTLMHNLLANTTP